MKLIMMWAEIPIENYKKTMKKYKLVLMQVVADSTSS